MSTENLVEKSQKECALIHAEALVTALKKAKHFGHVKKAVMKFISDVDAMSDADDNPVVLGDGDVGALFAQALKRRGKTPVRYWAPIVMPAD